ncbi:hypothetical protein CDO73_00605 [Saccharibacillus sp. O23]|uniref:hypothetical protein n=1 Tax=Saccharibacillus sp. O23 TaxID=2009338 RepID=UPI000B4E5DFD|nr:hypothetical protein [Saccharibacillus sp. O23]OWR33042.1 hypothetical protein CDO73_00605 [Saccharibacillus sp. O23]
MRETIKQALENKIPELSGHVHDLPPAGQSYSGFGASVTFGEEIYKNDWAGYRRIVKVWPYADAASGGFGKIEELAGKIEAALHEAVLGRVSGGAASATGNSVSDAAQPSQLGEADREPASAGQSQQAGDPKDAAFVCVYLGSADGDRLDAALGGMTRGLRFAVYRQPAGFAAGPDDAGAELTALAALTSALLGADWQIAADRWPAAHARPCVLWRLAGSRKVTAKPSAYDVRRTYAAHVLGRTAAEEREALSALAERLSSAQRLGPPAPGRRAAAIADVVADLEADGFLKGQLRLDVLERVTLPGGEQPGGSEEPPVLIGRVGLKQAD